LRASISARLGCKAAPGTPDGVGAAPGVVTNGS
jgi:hypothetical protein